MDDDASLAIDCQGGQRPFYGAKTAFFAVSFLEISAKNRYTEESSGN